MYLGPGYSHGIKLLGGHSKVGIYFHMINEEVNGLDNKCKIFIYFKNLEDKKHELNVLILIGL